MKASYFNCIEIAYIVEMGSLKDESQGSNPLTSRPS
jgi:hypothetical protein